MTSYKIEPALPSDAATLASQLISTQNDFRRFLDGTSDTSNRETNMLKWYAHCIEDPANRVLVVREEESGNVISHAQWELPKDKAEAPPTLPETDEEKAKIREKRKAAIKPGQNGSLLQEWWEKIDYLQTTFGSEPLYYLNALVTVPEHRGRGLASQLVKRLNDEADEKGMKVGLYTDGDGNAKHLYQKLGFVEVGQFEIKLEPFGGQGRHLELSMIRNPISQADK